MSIFLIQRVDTGEYLASYDVDFVAEYPPPGTPEWMRGIASWTHDLSEAMEFADLEAALLCRNQTPAAAPWRDDGRPNRPLTAYTLSLVQKEKVSQNG